MEKYYLIPFPDFSKILEGQKTTQTRREMLAKLIPHDEENMKGAERGILLGIGIYLIKSYVSFDLSNHYSSSSYLLEANKTVLYLSSKFEKYSEWRKISPKIMKLSEDLKNYSSKKELMTSIAELFAGKYFRLKRARV